MKKIFVLTSLILCLIGSNISLASVYNVNTLKRKISKREKKTPRKTILFHYGNLKNANLSHATLYDIEFYKTNFRDANLKNTIIQSCSFQRANLKNVDFSNAYFGRITFIRGAYCVEGANFANTKGLNNSKKQFLRENGAINVPEDDSDECAKMMFGTAAVIATIYGIIHLIGS